MTAISQPFWEGTTQGQLRLQRCDLCSAYQHYPRSVCKQCWGEELSWTQACGRATLYSYAIAVTPTHPSLVDKVPYVIALVDLEEGPRIATHVVNCPHDELTIGMDLRLQFSEDLAPPKHLPVFEPA